MFVNNHGVKIGLLDETSKGDVRGRAGGTRRDWDWDRRPATETGDLDFPSFKNLESLGQGQGPEATKLPATPATPNKT